MSKIWIKNTGCSRAYVLPRYQALYICCQDCPMSTGNIYNECQWYQSNLIYCSILYYTKALTKFLSFFFLVIKYLQTNLYNLHKCTKWLCLWLQKIYWNKDLGTSIILKFRLTLPLITQENNKRNHKILKCTEVLYLLLLVQKWK